MKNKFMLIGLTKAFLTVLFVTACYGCDTKSAVGAVNSQIKASDIANHVVEKVSKPPKPSRSPTSMMIKGLYLGMNITTVIPVLKRELGDARNALRFYEFSNGAVPDEGVCDDPKGLQPCDAVLFWIKRELEGIDNKKFPASYSSINIGLNEVGIPQAHPVLLGRIVADSQGKVIFIEFRNALIGALFQLDGSMHLDEFASRLNAAYSMHLEMTGYRQWSYRDASGTSVTVNGWDLSIEKVADERSRNASFN